jgi:hypothetical protein
MALHTFKINFRDTRSDMNTGEANVFTTVEYIETSVSNAMNRLAREYGATDDDLCQIVLVRSGSLKWADYRKGSKSPIHWSGD